MGIVAINAGTAVLSLIRQKPTVRKLLNPDQNRESDG